MKLIFQVALGMVLGHYLFGITQYFLVLLLTRA